MATYNPEADCLLLVDGCHGIHVPEIFCGHYAAELEAQGLGIEAAVILDIEADPEDRSMCWDEILDSATLEINGERWTLYQEQDLFAIRDGAELPEQW